MWMPGSICKVTMWWHAAAAADTNEGRKTGCSVEVMNLASMMEESREELPGNCGLFGRVNIDALTSTRRLWSMCLCHVIRPKLNVDPQARVSFADINCCDTVSGIQGLLQRGCWWLFHLSHIQQTCLFWRGEIRAVIHRGAKAATSLLSRRFSPSTLLQLNFVSQATQAQNTIHCGLCGRQNSSELPTNISSFRRCRFVQSALLLCMGAMHEGKNETVLNCIYVFKKKKKRIQTSVK